MVWAGGEGAGAARVQVPRRVGLVCCAHVLARAAAVPRCRRAAARQVRPPQAGHAAGASCEAHGEDDLPALTCTRSLGDMNTF